MPALPQLNGKKIDCVHVWMLTSTSECLHLNTLENLSQLSQSLIKMKTCGFWQGGAR